MTSQTNTANKITKCLICGHPVEESSNIGKVALIETLEHLSYIMECILIDANGEAKSELFLLVDSVREKVTNKRIPKDFLAEIEEAGNNFLSGDRKMARGQISSVSRSLWKQVMS